MKANIKISKDNTYYNLLLKKYPESELTEKDWEYVEIEEWCLKNKELINSPEYKERARLVQWEGKMEGCPSRIDDICTARSIENNVSRGGNTYEIRYTFPLCKIEKCFGNHWK